MGVDQHSGLRYPKYLVNVIFLLHFGLNYENKVDEEDTEDTKIYMGGDESDTMIM
jgi:hypothetical protein